MSETTVIVLGCDHRVQIAPDTVRTDEQSATFAELVEQIVREYSIQFIGEEINKKQSIAKTIAETLRLRYELVDIPPEVQLQVRHPIRDPGEYSCFEEFVFSSKYAAA